MNGLFWDCVFQGEYLTVRAEADDDQLYPHGYAPFEDLTSVLATTAYLNELVITSE